MSYSQRLTDTEKDIINELRRLLRSKIRYSRTYTYKGVINNIVKLKVWNWRSKDALNDEQLYHYCVSIIRGLEFSKEAFFLKPVIQIARSHVYGRIYEIPCMFFYFNV